MSSVLIRYGPNNEYEEEVTEDDLTAAAEVYDRLVEGRLDKF